MTKNLTESDKKEIDKISQSDAAFVANLEKQFSAVTNEQAKAKLANDLVEIKKIMSGASPSEQPISPPASRADRANHWSQVSKEVSRKTNEMQKQHNTLSKNLIKFKVFAYLGLAILIVLYVIFKPA